jgi:RHS repeat-associated protein
VLDQSGATANSYLYTGEQFDGSLGNYYLRARYYDPNSGRFTQMDTWMGRDSDPVTLHKYLYANGDSANNIDPSGNFSIGSVMAAVNIVSANASSAVVNSNLAFSNEPNPIQEPDRIRGNTVSPPVHVKKALEATFNESVDSVKVIERSTWAGFLSLITQARTFNKRWIIATTQRDRIFLNKRISAETFFNRPHLMLHEYFHVLRQWNTGRMNNITYLLNPSKWENEAEAYAVDNVTEFSASLECYKNPANRCE